MDKSKTTILLVEDDPSLGAVVRDFLAINGYVVDLALNGQLGWDAFNSKKYDLCVLDIMLPEKDGFTLAEMIRKKDEMVPIIFLTAKAAQEDRLKGFRTGADDYIVKPFNIEELLLRIEVFLKRSQGKGIPKSIYPIGKYVFNYQSLSLTLIDDVQDLTQREADLLRYLCIHKGEIVKREDVLNSVWGNDEYSTGRSLDVFISRLRKFLKDDPSVEIQNLHAVGFRLKVE